jgi:hypothetical protein
MDKISLAMAEQSNRVMVLGQTSQLDRTCFVSALRKRSPLILRLSLVDIVIHHVFFASLLLSARLPLAAGLRLAIAAVPPVAVGLYFLFPSRCGSRIGRAGLVRCPEMNSPLSLVVC